MPEDKSKLPDPDQIQKDIQDFLADRYGDNVVMAQVDTMGSKETTTDPKEEDPTAVEFNMTPEELEAYLREYLVQQEEAIEILSTKVATHFNRMRWEKTVGKDQPKIPGLIKPNILMLGPTGVGKTYMVKLIADHLGVPFVKGDATKFSETGYVGGDVEDLVRELVKVAKGNIKLAEYGIIYIDEIDKIASSQGLAGPDVSRTGVQRNLLKLMEETEVDLKVPHDLASQMEAVIETQKTGKAPSKKVSTRNILFIVSGAFSGLEKIVERRMNRQPIGFKDNESDNDNSKEIMSDVTTQDLIQYGFESEFIGRLPVMAKLHSLDVNGLFEILSNPYNAVIQGKIRDFASYGIKLKFTDDALKRLAEEAHKEKTGARGLTRAVETALLPFEKRLPSTRIKNLKVTVGMVDSPRAGCDDIILGTSLKIAVADFKEKYGIAMNISSASKKWLQEHVDDKKTPGAVLAQKLEENHYAFSLLKKTTFQVTVAFLEDPKGYLENLIRKSYKDE